MRNFKKLATLLVLALVIFSMLALASCGTGDGTSNSSGDANVTSSSTGVTSTDSSTGGASSDTNGTDSSVGGSTSDSSDTTSSVPDGSTTDSSTIDGGNEEDEVNPNLVTITVLNQLGKPVKDAVIQVCQGENCFNKPIQTGADGIGSREYTLGEGELKAKILSIKGMDDFLASEEYVYFDDDSREITITIQKITVNVLDDNNDAVEGAQIQLYQGEYAFGGELITDADGVASGFVALTSGEFSAKVIKYTFNANKYELSKAPVAFGVGEYEGFIEVNTKKALVVKISTLMESAPLAGIKIKLWLDNSFEDTAVTDANGMVQFENVGNGKYSIEIVFESPAYVAIGASEEDGRHYFGDSSVLDITVVELTHITYTVNVSNGVAGQTVRVYDVDNAEFVDAGVLVTDENGTVTFDAPHGNYTVVLVTEDGKYAKPVSFEKGGKAVGTIEVTEKVAGSSKEAPIILTLGEFTFDFAAGEAVWFAIPNANGKCFKIGAEVIFTFEGLVEGVDGCYCFTAEKGEMAVFSVTSDVNVDGMWMETQAPGTVHNPIEVGGNAACDTTVYAGAIVYYSYTADKDGTLIVTIDGDVMVFFDEFYYGLNMEAGVYMYPVKAGQTILVSLDGSNLMKGLDTVVNFSIEEKKLDYTISVTKDGDLAQGVVVILYANDGEKLIEVARGTTDESGMLVFEDVVFAGNYVIKAECPEGFTYIMEEIELGLEVYGSYYLTKIKTGEADAPFEFDTTDELKETAEVKENGTVWYTLYVRPSQGVRYYLVAKSGNAIIKVYNNDTNEDGIIDANDTPIGVSVTFNGESTYIFETNNMLYTIAVSTIDGSAENIELEYVSDELPAGSTEENAIEITEAGTFKANVDGTVYYVFTGNDSCKLTVSLTGNATLKRIIRSMDGSVLEDVDGNVLVIDDTEATWIYFAISADEAGEYEFTVTVE